MKFVFFVFITLIYTSIQAHAQPHKDSRGKPQILKIRSGDTFFSLLKRHGFSAKETNQMMVKMKPLSLWALSPKSDFWKYRSKQSTLLKFFHPASNTSLNLKKNNGKVSANLVQEKYTIKVKSVRGKINGSIISSINQHIPDQIIGYRFLDAYRFNYNLRKVVQRNAPFSLTVEKKYLDGIFVGYGEILKTQIKVKGKLDTRYFIKTKDGGSFLSVYDLQDDRPLFAPVNYVRISSEFQPRRLHPITKRRIPHMGLDFELPEGTPLYPAQSGTVLRVGKNRAAGRYVVIKHKNGLESFYNHLSYIDKKIKKGARVKNGQQIGAIGCSGYCTKPHLHFAVKKRGRYQNPIKFLKTFSYMNQAPLTKKVLELRRVAKTSFSK